MTNDELLIGTLAIVLAMVAGAISMGPWLAPYRLRSFAGLSERYGKPVARGAWALIALASLTAGTAILTGMRPGYAKPAERAELDR